MACLCWYINSPSYGSRVGIEATLTGCYKSEACNNCNSDTLRTLIDDPEVRRPLQKQKNVFVGLLGFRLAHLNPVKRFKPQKATPSAVA